jgi:hypothetical protein
MRTWGRLAAVAATLGGFGLVTRRLAARSNTQIHRINQHPASPAVSPAGGSVAADQSHPHRDSHAERTATP